MATGHRQRMRNRFYKEGIDNFEPHEALEMILYFTIPRHDTNAIAHRLIEHFGSFHGVLEANREALLKFGLTENTVAHLKMFPAFVNYYTQSRAWGTAYFSDSTAIGNYAVNKIGERTNEVFGVLCLTAQRKFINFEIIEEGTVASATVSPRKVAECALRNNASKVVFVHNHPSGSLMPSIDDKELTKRLASMLDTMDIGLVDHIIVANGRFSSMSEQGII
ncbi:MAG: DNA repair protein RadC [Clostridia bacterium]|nr:DNA repair protein RadC [Clostridia bacterium]